MQKTPFSQLQKYKKYTIISFSPSGNSEHIGYFCKYTDKYKDNSNFNKNYRAMFFEFYDKYWKKSLFNYKCHYIEDNLDKNQNCSHAARDKIYPMFLFEKEPTPFSHLILNEKYKIFLCKSYYRSGYFCNSKGYFSIIQFNKNKYELHTLSVENSEEIEYYRIIPEEEYRKKLRDKFNENVLKTILNRLIDGFQWY